VSASTSMTMDLKRKGYFVSDPVRSIIQTQHPRLADEVKDAIAVMQKVLDIAGESIPTATPRQAAAFAPPSNESNDYGILATQDTQASGDSNVKATVDSQSGSDRFSVSQVIKLASGEAFGRYQIVNMLGEGAMGAVYLAYDPPLERHVALKIPIVQSSLALERFYIEAKATATLRSPNICPVYDVGQISGVHYISMAFIDGRTLSKAIKESPLSLEQSLTILSKIARGIQKAHERGVIHRDLKPDNIMIDMEGEPVVMDFGLAVKQDDGDERITKDGALVGSPAYMSPEQAEGKKSLIGPATDIYSLGVVFYEMLTQRLPFQGSIMSVLRQIASEPPAPPSKYNEALVGSPIEKVCLKMLEKSPSDRIACMGDVADAADECRAIEVSQRAKQGKRKRFFGISFGKA